MKLFLQVNLLLQLGLLLAGPPQSASLSDALTKPDSDYDPSKDPKISHLISGKDDILVTYGELLHKVVKARMLPRVEFMEMFDRLIAQRQAKLGQVSSSENRAPMPKAPASSSSTIASSTPDSSSAAAKSHPSSSSTASSSAPASGQGSNSTGSAPVDQSGSQAPISTSAKQSFQKGSGPSTSPQAPPSATVTKQPGQQGWTGTPPPDGTTHTVVRRTVEYSKKHPPIVHLIIRSPNGQPDLWEGEANAVRRAIPDASLLRRAFRYERERRRREALYNKGLQIRPRVKAKPAQRKVGPMTLKNGKIESLHRSLAGSQTSSFKSSSSPPTSYSSTVTTTTIKAPSTSVQPKQPTFSPASKTSAPTKVGPQPVVAVSDTPTRPAQNVVKVKKNRPQQNATAPVTAPLTKAAVRPAPTNAAVAAPTISAPSTTSEQPKVEDSSKAEASMAESRPEEQPAEATAPGPDDAMSEA